MSEYLMFLNILVKVISRVGLNKKLNEADEPWIWCCQVSLRTARRASEADCLLCVVITWKPLQNGLV